ncbi:acyl-CoA dehydrogenase family protein [Jatrophihabitans sp. YIM 134969]
MDLDPTEEQQALAEAVGDLLEKRYEPRTRLELLDSERGWSETLWRQYADMGLLGLTVDEQYGGAGMGTAELATVVEQFGRALVLEPFLATVVLGSSLVAAVGTAEQQAEILPAVAGGTLLLAFAWAEPGARWSTAARGVTASEQGGGWTLRGEKTDVLGGDTADRLVVSAALPDGGTGLFLVDAADVTRSAHPQQDGLRAADIRFDGTAASPLGSATDATAAIDAVVDLATAMLCAEAVGAIDRMLWLTVDYLKTRVQFGTPISVFQALQFRAADMYVSLEQARSMALMARLALEGDDAAERRRAVRAAKVQVDQSARHVGQEAVQLHGGIGITMEYPVGHYLKRTAVIAKTFGDTDGFLVEVGTGEGLIAPA